MKIVSKVDKQIIITPKKFGVEKEYTLTLKAGEPKEVDDKIALEYSKAYPHIYKIVDEDVELTEDETDTDEAENTNDNFNPIEFLESNYDNLAEELDKLSRKKLIILAESLGLKASTQSRERIIERILKDIEARSK